MAGEKNSICCIDDEILHFTDKYIKKVIINCRNKYYARNNKFKNKGLVFLNVEDCSTELTYNDVNYDRISKVIFDVSGIKIPVYDCELSEELSKLTETQRTILLKNVVLQIPLNKIAQERGISCRMVEKHKHNAIQILRRRMKP